MATFLSQLFAQMATGQRQFIYWASERNPTPRCQHVAESRRVSTYSSKSGCISKCIKSDRSPQNIVAKRNPLAFSHVILPVCHHRLPPAAATPDTAVDFNLTANSHHDIGVQAKTATKDHKSRTPNQNWFKGTSPSMRFALHFQENMYVLCIKEFGCWDSYQNDALQATPQMPKSTPSQTCEQTCQKRVLVQLLALLL